MLRRRRRDVDDRRGCQEDVRIDHDVEEGLARNVDVEVVVDEVREVDLLQLSKTMSKKTMKLAKSISMLEVDAIDGRLEERDLVEEYCVEEVGKAMVMCRCGGVMSLCMGRGTEMDALLPCRKSVLKFALKGVPRWVDLKSLGLSSHRSMHGRWSP